MLRSLFTGVSGLRNHLIRLDVIGNNIANINTIGFKAGRVTFQDTMAHILQGATRPNGDLGGINPMQIGSGMSVGSIDTFHSQGALESTGNIMDLAIMGDGFFIVNDGDHQYYTRAGAFQFDANGRLVTTGNGFSVQGITADSQGIINSDSPVADIVLPFEQKAPAKASTQLSLVGNLDANSVKGTILDSERMYGLELAGNDTDINRLCTYGSVNKVITGLVHNESFVEISVDGGATKQKYYYNEDPDSPTATVPVDGNGIFNSLDDLALLIENDFANTTVAIENGALKFDSTSNGQNLVISSSHSDLNRTLRQANVTDFSSGISSATDVFMHQANGDDLLLNLRNASGESTGLADTDEISFNARIGENALTESKMTLAADSSYQQLADFLGAALGTVNENGVVIDSNDGSLMIRGDGGTSNIISKLELEAKSATGENRTIFNQVFSASSGAWTEIQKAVDGLHQVPMTYYDSLGNANTLTFTLTQDNAIPNRWFWEAVPDSPATITDGREGYVVFNEDGSLQEFVYNNRATSLEINPNNGSDSPINIDINAGSSGKFDGITQGTSSSTLVATGQDGYTMGLLNYLLVSKTGEVSGVYTNGVTKILAQIVLANFNNPNALLKTGDNMYQTSNNSGAAIIGKAGTSFHSEINSGALEMSNVDLPSEFTNMIIAQRGFQANARVITTSDELITEVVNLKR